MAQEEEVGDNKDKLQILRKKKKKNGTHICLLPSPKMMTWWFAGNYNLYHRVACILLPDLEKLKDEIRDPVGVEGVM